MNPSIYAKFKNNDLFVTDSGEKTKYNRVLEVSESKEFQSTHRNLVFCFCENKSESILGYLALLACQAVPLVLNPTISDKHLKELIQIYSPNFIFAPSVRLVDLGSFRIMFSIGEYALTSVDSISNYSINSSLALLISTSGSTGSPKYIRLSRENIMANAQAISQYLSINQDDKPITTLPASYTYGLSIIHSHILNGATIALTDKTFFDAGFWSYLKEVKATSFGGVPYHYEILKKLRFEKFELPSLKTLTQAGGRMSSDATREFAVNCYQKGIRFITMYGQAEATARMSYLIHDDLASKAGSIGGAIPGGNLWIVDEKGNKILLPNQPGELVYSGNNVCLGYADNQSDLALGDEFNGILMTGDMAYFDSDGYFFITGRKKRFLKIFGHRLNLQDIEDYLCSSGFITVCAGRDDLLEVYIEDMTESRRIEIKNKLVLEYRVSPKAIHVISISKFPRNETGKILYSQLQLKSIDNLV